MHNGIYFAQHKAQCCANMRRRYVLTELIAKPHVQHQYVKKLNKKLLSNPTVLLVKAFKTTHKIMAKSMCKAAVASIASKTLLSKVLQVCKHYAGSLLKAILSITKLVITKRSD